MQYDVSFGSLARRGPAAGGSPGKRFRLGVMGDFSGRANAGTLQIGKALATRRPVKVDVDTLDDVMARLRVTLSLQLAPDEGPVAVEIASLDEFHPDELVTKLEVFEALTALRRRLNTRASFDRAAKEVLSWSGAEPLPPQRRRSRGGAVATDRRLSDFSRLVGRPATATATTADVDALLRRVIGPFVQPARDARQEQLVARVDEALGVLMRRVLHHPDFQAAEALWRGVDFLVRRLETGATLEIVLLDVSAEELAADLAAVEDLAASGTYGLLVEQPSIDANQGAFAAVIGLYGFELSPPHADLLGRVAQVADAANAPFIAAIGPDGLQTPMHEQHPLIRDAWSALRALPASHHLGLATPRFLLRLPYGKRSDPIDSFKFEEFVREDGLSGMLWGHPALVPGLLLADTFARQGAKMRLGSMLTVGDLPYHVYVDADGDQTALPCTERLYNEREAVRVGGYGVMPLLSLRGRPEVRLGGLAAVAGGALAGFWETPVAPTAPRRDAAAETVAAEAEARAAEAGAPAVKEGATEAVSAGDLDALLAGLGDDAATAAPLVAPQEAPPEAPVESDAAADDLDALLAGLSADPAPSDGSEDLDALLASLR